MYPFVYLGARLFAHFDIRDADARAALRRSTIPVIFYHGDVDGFVPCYMSEQNYEACASEKKRFVVIKGAEHGLCYMVGKLEYERELRDFFPGLEAEGFVYTE